MGMVLVIRRLLAILAGCGLTASIAIYLGTFRGRTFDSLMPLPFVLHLGAFILLLPIILIEYSVFQNEIPAWALFSGGRPIKRGTFSWKGYGQGVPQFEETFFWKKFSQGKPKLIVPTVKLLGLFFIFHFILFLVQSHAASPQIKNGQYVLSSGRFVKTITQSEYFRLKGQELRMFAAGWIFFYFVPAMYWWFPQNRKQKADI